MENFTCFTCELSDPIQFECGHIQCRSCSMVIELDIQCYRCYSLAVSNDDVGAVHFTKLCNDCNGSFDSKALYEEHKKKKSCDLEKYGCRQETDTCSRNRHLTSEFHLDAMKLRFEQILTPPLNFDIIKSLTECLSQCDNMVTTEEDESERIGSLLVSDFALTSTSSEIERCDNSPLTDEQRTASLKNQSTRYEQIGDSIYSELNQLDEHQIDEQNILEQLTTMSTIQNQIQICNICNVQYDISLIHNCQLSVHELCEKLNKLLLESKQGKENHQRLIQCNKDLVFQNNMLQIDLLNVPFSKDGILIWRIDNLSNKIDKAYRCQESFITSPTFLSLTDEHPLNARLFLYGDRSGHPKYISLHIQLSPGGKNMLHVPVTCCLVDHTTHHHHIVKRDNVCLNQQNIGTICHFPQFIETNLVYQQDSRFVDENTLCLIVKVHQEQSSQYNDLSLSIQHALRHIN